MYTHTLTTRYNDGEAVIEAVSSQQADGAVGFDGTIAGLATDVEILVAFTLAKVKSLLIYASAALTLYTNATDGTGGDTIAVPAASSIVWADDMLGAIPLTQNVTKFYANNAGAAGATLKIRALVDSTP